MRSDVIELNRDGRALLNHLYDAHVKYAGEKFGMSDGDEDMIREFGEQRYAKATQWLESKGLSEPVSMCSFTISDYGVDVAGDEELLDQLLPVPVQPAAMAPTGSNEVYELNALARTLLAYLHRWHLKGNGRPFTVAPNAQTFGETGLDKDTYDRAKGRLFTKQLGKPSGTGGVMTITPRGVDVAEDPDLLDSELPVAPRVRAAFDVPRDVADSLAEVRATALDFVSDAELRAIIERDLGELSDAVNNGMHKSTALMAGSIVESLLLDVAALRPDLADSYLPKNKKFPADASIDHLVAIVVGEGMLDKAAHQLVTTVKDYRDLIHPDRERRVRAKVDGATTSTILALLRLVVRSLADAKTSGRIAAFVKK